MDLLLTSREFSGNENERKRREIIGNLLSTRDFAALDLKISYPKRASDAFVAGERPKFTPNLTFGAGSQPQLVEPKFFKMSTSSVAHEEFKRLSELAGREPDFDERRRLVTKIMALGTIIEVEGELVPTHDIFISFIFNRPELSEIVRNFLYEQKCRPVTGQEPNEETVFRKVIINRIRNAQGFIGIWTNRDDGDFSPWLLWELGVAQAFNLPFRLLISDKVDKKLWHPINPEQQHVVFRELEFKEKAHLATSSLVGDIKRIRTSRNYY
jgi:hypothetical protein